MHDFSVYHWIFYFHHCIVGKIHYGRPNVEQNINLFFNRMKVDKCHWYIAYNIFIHAPASGIIQTHFRHSLDTKNQDGGYQTNGHQV